jgi:protein subunit release factor B
MPPFRPPISLPTLRLAHTRHFFRPFSTTPAISAKNLPPRRVFQDDELLEKFLHGSGPGGQKINKTSSAVQLKHLPTGIVVKYQDTRSRSLNRKMARKILGEKLEELELGDEARTRVRAREKGKKKASADKKKRRKYRALEAGSASEDEGEGEGEGEVDREMVEDDAAEGVVEGADHVEAEPAKPAEHRKAGGRRRGG